MDLADRGITVQQYDHTVANAPLVHDRLKFFRTKIVAMPTDGEGVFIPAILSDAQIERDASVILKIDIEGDEWAVFDACSPADLNRFSQVLAEFHNFDHGRDPAWLGRASRVMEKLSSIFGVFHVHANNWAGMAVVGNVYFPETLEISFANRGRYQFEESSELFPTPLDQANNPLRPERIPPAWTALF